MTEKNRTLTASEKAAVLGLTDSQMRDIVREHDRRTSHGLFISQTMHDEADLCRAALGGARQ